MRITRNTVLHAMVVLLLELLSQSALAEQYRSKLLLNPGQSLDEAASVSIEQLEAQFGDIRQGYARSSAGVQLARHHVEQRNYDKAVAYYKEALAAQGLSDVVNRDLHRELAGVYLAMGSPGLALQTLSSLGHQQLLTDPQMLLTYAYTHFALNDYLQVASTLDQLFSLITPGQEDLYQQLIALAYQIQDYDLCASALEQQLHYDMSNSDHWFQLVAVLLKQNKAQQALAYLALAKLQGVAFSEQNILLLGSLYASQGNPYKGALVLSEAMSRGVVSATGEHYRVLFEYWLHAQEQKRALQALQQAATLTRDAELYLYWAQMLMQNQNWERMHNVMMDFCSKSVPPLMVGRANLMLGISEYKLNRPQQAFQAFANATLVGGANDLAGQWLDRLEAEGIMGNIPARPSGPCQAIAE